MKPNFTVIRGGKNLSPECRGRKFVSGYATNTRLMGVIGLELKWDVVEDSQVKTLNQIFYLDAEEFGDCEMSVISRNRAEEFYLV